MNNYRVLRSVLASCATSLMLAPLWAAAPALRRALRAPCWIPETGLRSGNSIRNGDKPYGGFPLLFLVYTETIFAVINAFAFLNSKMI